MPIKSKQIFSTIVIQFDDVIWQERYTIDALTGRTAKIKIVKILDANAFIEIDLFNGWIDWYNRYPLATGITQTKGLTVMVVT